MAETVRERILARIKTVLEGISVAGGYRSDISSVQRYLQSGNSLVNVPCVIINAGPDKWDQSRTPVIRSLFSVFLDVWIRQEENDTTPTDKILNDLIADIYQALWADTTLNENALDINFLSIDPFETIEGQPHAGVTIELEIMYGFQQSDPEVVG